MDAHPEIVVVDPDPTHRRDLAASIAAGRLTNPVAGVDGLAALPSRLVERPAAVLTASRLPDGSCLDVLDLVGTYGAGTPVVVLGDGDPERVIAAAHARGAAAYLSWPVAPAAVVGVLQGLELHWTLSATGTR